MSIISILCFKASYKLFRWLFIFSTILSSLNGVSTLNLPQFTIKSKVIELLDEEGGTSDFTMKLFTISALVILGGVFAGLTIGLMGLDETNLQVLMVAGDSKERIYARKVFELLKRGKHWVLVTLLLSNVIVNETLPIIMDSLFGGGWPAVLISTALIVLFGEIIPQAICVRYGLAIGAGFSWFVLFLMYTMFPIAYPIALLLDYFLGEHHGIMYRKSELKTFVSLHKNGGIESLNEDEVQIIGSVLDLREKSVSAIMTPLENSYTLSADCLLDEKTVDEILSAGYSRIPVYEPPNPTHFIGMLLVKKLITYDPEDAWSVRDFPLSSLPETSPDTSCLDILNYFQEGRSHMVLVSEDPGGDKGALGVITLEDVIEELIGEEIIDETDVYVDVQNKIKVVRHPPRQSRQRSYPYYKSNLLKSSAILHTVLDYLYANGFTESFNSLKTDAHQNDFNPDPKQKYAGLLEKKWTSVIRLQKKITQMSEELNNAPLRKTNSAVDWVPRAPEKYSLTGHRNPITRVTFHPVFSVLASASEDTTIKIWDYETGEFERTLKSHTKAVQDITFDPKGNYLVTCSADLTIKVYCIKTYTGHLEWVRMVSPSEDGKWIVTSSNDQTARLWEVQSGDCKMDFRDHDHVVECAIFAPLVAYPLIRELIGVDKDPKGNKDQPIPGQYIVTGSRDKTIKLWDSTGQCLRTFVGHDNWVRGLVFHPSGKFLLSASDDKTLKIWDVKTGRCTKTLEAHAHFVTCIAFNSGTPVVATGYNN
ncbi:16545_t:CDS:10 [Entrophospora sp. SA101]|nr:16545_t:CDS:10 [Entrophospora sp. SA101]